MIDPVAGWSAVLALVPQAKWPTPELLQGAYQDLQAAWAVEAERELVVRCCTSFGKDSGLLNRTMWTLADAREHERLLEEKKKGEPASDPDPVPVGGNTPGHLNDLWRQAVKDRQINVAASKAHRDAVIRDAKAAHELLEGQWTTYVANMREKVRQARGS